MGRRLNIGFSQGPNTLYAPTGRYGVLIPQASFSVGGGSPPVGQRWSPGIAVAISYAQRGLGPSGQTLSPDSGAFSYSAGTTGAPLTITGNYSSGTMPGGHLGTGTSSGCNTGTGVGGHTLSRNGTGPCVNFNSTHRTVALVPRYPWVDIEPTKNNYFWDVMDADLAQCIALGVLWFPMIVYRTFTAPEAPTGTGGNPLPTYMKPFASPFAAGITQVWRWDTTNVNPRICAIYQAIGARYDLCANFGGVASQETSTGNVDSAATNWVSGSYEASLDNEADAFASSSPHSRQLALQNFGGNEGNVMIDRYSAHIQPLGAILSGPDLVCCGGSVYTSCYTSVSGGTRGRGRYSGYHSGGTIQSGVNFQTTGPTSCSMQRAEWVGIAPACTGAGQSVARALSYGLGSTSGAIGTQPNYLNIDMPIMDWHQGAGTPNSQQFTPDGVALIQNNAIPMGSWTP